MIYYTGDIHGDVLQIRDMVTKYEITAQDVIVILGDVGMNYYGNNHGDQHRKKKLNKLGVPVFCIHGNHEMRPETIPTYHEDKWRGGTVYVEDAYPNLLFAKDGEVYDLNGQSALVIGGACKSVHGGPEPGRQQSGRAGGGLTEVWMPENYGRGLHGKNHGEACI